MSRNFTAYAQPRSPWKPVLFSIVFGGIIGAFQTSTWQVAVETAQVLAGLVEYSESNPFYRYHASAWSLVHQLLALLLYVGIGERALSIALSATLCAATFGGITLCCHAVGGRSEFAILAPVAWYVLFRDSNAYGVVYPLVLTGTHHTYGVLGRAAALWLAGLVAHHYYKPALFLLAILPALHLTWGLYAGAVVAFAWLVSSRDLSSLRKNWPWLFTGAIVTAASFTMQRYWTASLPEVDAATAAPYLEAFLTHWDGHRVPASIFVPGTLVVATVTTSAALLLAFEKTNESSTRFMYATALAAGVSGLGLLWLAQFPQWLATPMATAMPGRFANFALLHFPVLLFGTLLRARGRAGIILLLVLAAYFAWKGLFDTFLSSDRFGWGLTHWNFLLPLQLAATSVLIRKPDEPQTRHQLSITAAIVLGGLLSVTLFPWNQPVPLYHQSEDPVIAQARGGAGLVITGPGIELMQLRTRRPILLNTGGLDQLPYVPASGPAMKEALEQVYGISILDPPAAIRKRRVGGLPHDVAVDLFAQRSLEEWQDIADRFGGGEAISVLVHPSHQLSLEPTATSEHWRLYDIPSRNQEK